MSGRRLVDATSQEPFDTPDELLVTS